MFRTFFKMQGNIKEYYRLAFLMLSLKNVVEMESWGEVLLKVLDSFTFSELECVNDKRRGKGR